MEGGKCPKCDGTRIAKTKYALYLGTKAAGPSFALYVCADCRYSEQYMQESVDERVKVLDRWDWVKPEEGPFR